MKICDICRQTVSHLNLGAGELERCESCDDCWQDILRRYAVVERHVAEVRSQLRAEAIDAWRRERGGQGLATQPSGKLPDP